MDDIQKYHEIHAIDSEKAIGLYIFMGWETTHEVKCQEFVWL